MLNCEEKANRKLLREALLKLPMFKDVDPREITTDMLEKVIWKMEDKYPVMLSYVMRSPTKEEGQPRYLSFMLKNSETHEWIKSVYAISMFEGFAKVALCLYAYIRKLKESSKDEN
jgi:hypothetical protein